MSRLGSVLLFIGLLFLVAWFVAMRAMSGTLLPFVWVLLAIGLGCFFGAIAKDIRFFVDLAGQRTTKHGVNLGVLVIIVLAILVMVNFISYKHIKKFDYTKEGLHSLSDQTKSIVKSLDSDLEVRGFFGENQQEASERNRFKDLSDLYISQSSKVHVQFINPVKSPEKAKEFDINSSGVVSIEYKGRKAKLDELTEQSFTNAIIKVSRDKNKVIYFVTGHGERDISSGEPTELQNFKKALTDSSYDVKTLSFTEKQQVPDDASVVVIAGPKTAYFEPEIKALNDYLYKGGKLLLALDPGTKNKFGAACSRRWHRFQK